MPPLPSSWSSRGSPAACSWPGRLSWSPCWWCNEASPRMGLTQQVETTIPGCQPGVKDPWTPPRRATAGAATPAPPRRGRRRAGRLALPARLPMGCAPRSCRRGSAGLAVAWLVRAASVHPGCCLMRLATRASAADHRARARPDVAGTGATCALRRHGPVRPGAGPASAAGAIRAAAFFGAYFAKSR